jgi:hypothetical protein
MPELNVLERARLVSDAILLERAVRVLERRDPTGDRLQELLTEAAYKLREEAEGA